MHDERRDVLCLGVDNKSAKRVSHPEALKLSKFDKRMGLLAPSYMRMYTSSRRSANKVKRVHCCSSSAIQILNAW